MQHCHADTLQTLQIPGSADAVAGLLPCAVLTLWHCLFLQKFKPWRGKDKEGEDDEELDWDPSDGDKSEEDEDAILKDGTFKPIYAFWAEKGLTAAKNMRPGGGRERRIKQVGLVLMPPC